MRRLKSFSLAAGAVLVAASARAAGEGREGLFNLHLEVIGEPFAQCRSFQILHDYHLDWLVEVRVLDTDVRMTDNRFYNARDPSISVRGGPGEPRSPSHLEGEAGVLTAVVPGMKVVVPGVGPVFVQTGQLFANMYAFQIPRTLGLGDEGDLEAAPLCAALAPHEAGVARDESALRVEAESTSSQEEPDPVAHP